MSTSLKDSQANFILKSRVALTNVETQPEIAAEMAELGYDAAKISEGKSLIANVEAALNLQQDEKGEESAASAAFKELRSKVSALFRAHRKKALFAFLDDPDAVKDLGINVSPATVYADWRNEVGHFYDTLLTNEAYLQLVNQVKLTTDELTAAKELLPSMDAAYSEYYRETGESQEATRKKDEALHALETYMRRFWRAADIALEDKPQLKEALMKGV